MMYQAPLPNTLFKVRMQTSPDFIEVVASSFEVSKQSGTLIFKDNNLNEFGVGRIVAMFSSYEYLFAVEEKE